MTEEKNQVKPPIIRKSLVDSLGTEAGKTVYSRLTTGEKYTGYNLSYMELKQLVDTMYATIYEQIYTSKYGKNIATELMKQTSKEIPNES